MNQRRHSQRIYSPPLLTAQASLRNQIVSETACCSDKNAHNFSQVLWFARLCRWKSNMSTQDFTSASLFCILINYTPELRRNLSRNEWVALSAGSVTTTEFYLILCTSPFTRCLKLVIWAAGTNTSRSHVKP